MNILSLDTQCTGDWLIKVSANSVDGTILIFAFHPQSQKSHLKAFTAPEAARKWVMEVSKLK